MFAAVDPIYMLILIKLLGPGYEVWDKAASIRFRRPGRSTLRAAFRVDRAELEAIKSEVAQSGKSERRYTVDLTDDAGEVCATCEKLLSIRPRQAKSTRGVEGILPVNSIL